MRAPALRLFTTLFLVVIFSIWGTETSGFEGNELPFHTGDRQVVPERSFWMSADGSLNRTGKIQATIRVWSREAAAGFTGRAVVILKDSRGEVLDARFSDSYGVNGELLVTARSDRTETWHAEIPLDLVGKVSSLDVNLENYGRPTEERLAALLKEIEKSRLVNADLLIALQSNHAQIYEFQKWLDRADKQGLVRVDKSTAPPSALITTGQEDIRVIGGTPTSEYPAVGAILLLGAPHCTGTAILARVVLTAAHCLENDGLPYDINQISFAQGGDVTDQNTKKHRVMAKAVKEGYKKLPGGSTENDVALLLLKDDVVGETLPLPAGDSTKQLTGATLWFVGYGYWFADQKGSSGRKAKVAIRISTLDELTFRYSANNKNTCNGDSGGPALYRDPDTEKVWVVGITAWGDERCRSKGVNMRVDAYLGWIQKRSASPGGEGWEKAVAQGARVSLGAVATR